jgi:hypothetical protein
VVVVKPKTSNLSLLCFIFMSVFRQVISFSLLVCFYVYFSLLFSFFSQFFPSNRGLSPPTPRHGRCYSHLNCIKWNTCTCHSMHAWSGTQDNHLTPPPPSSSLPLRPSRPFPNIRPLRPLLHRVYFTECHAFSPVVRIGSPPAPQRGGGTH